MGHNPDSDKFCLTVLFRGELFWVSKARCRPGVACALPEASVANHAIVFPTWGVFVRRSALGTVVGDPNHAVFYNPKDAFRSSHPGAQGDDTDVVTVREDVLRDAVMMFDPSASERPGNLMPFGDVAIDPQTFLLERSLMRAVDVPAGTADALAVEELGLELIQRVVSEAFESRGYTARGTAVSAGSAHGPGPTARAAHAAVAERTKALLAQRFRERLTIDAISDAVESSPFHLCRLFKRLTGLSIHRYLNRLRLREAAERLSAGEKNLMELGLSLGYSSHSHFTEAFRREFGLTPSAWRTTVGRIGATELREVIDALRHGGTGQEIMVTRRVAAAAGVGAARRDGTAGLEPGIQYIDRSTQGMEAVRA